MKLEENTVNEQINGNNLEVETKVLWPNPIINKFPASKADVERELGPLENVYDAMNRIPAGIETIVLAALFKYQTPVGITYTLAKEGITQKRYQLKSIVDGLTNGRYRGVRLVQKYKAGPIYGYYVIDTTYYETY